MSLLLIIKNEYKVIIKLLFITKSVNVNIKEYFN